MLAKICEGIPDALRQLGSTPFLAEHKYDGQRAQIHLLADGTVKVFSRNCEDRSPSFPDVADAVRAAAQGDLAPHVLLKAGREWVSDSMHKSNADIGNVRNAHAALLHLPWLLSVPSVSLQQRRITVAKFASGQLRHPSSPC